MPGVCSSNSFMLLPVTVELDEQRADEASLDDFVRERPTHDEGIAEVLHSEQLRARIDLAGIEDELLDRRDVTRHDRVEVRTAAGGVEAVLRGQRVKDEVFA